jgi:hypothetical protein
MRSQIQSQLVALEQDVAFKKARLERARRAGRGMVEAMLAYEKALRALAASLPAAREEGLPTSRSVEALVQREVSMAKILAKRI